MPRADRRHVDDLAVDQLHARLGPEHTDLGDTEVLVHREPVAPHKLGGIGHNHGKTQCQPADYFPPLGALSSTFTVYVPARISLVRARTLSITGCGTLPAKVPSGLSSLPLAFMSEYEP